MNRRSDRVAAQRPLSRVTREGVKRPRSRSGGVGDEYADGDWQTPPVNSRLTGGRQTPTDGVIVRSVAEGRFSTRRMGARRDPIAPQAASRSAQQVRLTAFAKATAVKKPDTTYISRTLRSCRPDWLNRPFCSEAR